MEKHQIGDSGKIKLVETPEKRLGLKWFLLILLLTVSISRGGETIAADSCGIVVVIKEKYGGYFMDTCTVVMDHAGDYVLVHRNKPSSRYPKCNHSLQFLGE